MFIDIDFIGDSDFISFMQLYIVDFFSLSSPDTVRERSHACLSDSIVFGWGGIKSFYKWNSQPQTIFYNRCGMQCVYQTNKFAIRQVLIRNTAVLPIIVRKQSSYHQNIVFRTLKNTQLKKP